MSTSTSAARWSGGSSARAPRAPGCRRSPARTCASGPGSAPWSGLASTAPRAACSSRSSGSGSAARTLRRRSRSRQALTTIRCSQVVTAASPRNDSARRKAETSASWRASAASSGLPVVRRATAHSRSRWRRNSSPNASGSPARCASIRATSWRLVDSSTPPARHGGQDLTVMSAISPRKPPDGRRQLGQPDEQVAGRRCRVEGDVAALGGVLLPADPVELVDGVRGLGDALRRRRTRRRRWGRPTKRTAPSETSWSSPRSSIRPTPGLSPPSSGSPR